MSTLTAIGAIALAVAFTPTRTSAEPEMAAEKLWPAGQESALGKIYQYAGSEIVLCDTKPQILSIYHALAHEALAGYRKFSNLQQTRNIMGAPVCSSNALGGHAKVIEELPIQKRVQLRDGSLVDLRVVKVALGHLLPSGTFMPTGLEYFTFMAPDRPVYHT